MFCSVCDREIKEFAFGPCNHKDMCSICLLHWKLLYNDNKCPTCKVSFPLAVDFCRKT